MKANLNALIIGCGNIGCCYDSPESAEILTHAHALSLKGCDISFYDVDTERSEAAARKWNGKAVSTINGRYEIVVVSTSTPAQNEILSVLNPEMLGSLVVEKPFCDSKHQMEKHLSKFSKTPIFVNYSRLFINEYRQIKQRISRNEFGKYLKVVGKYTKGFKNNGSHHLSLLHFLTGETQLKLSVLSTSVEKKSGFKNFDIFFKADSQLNGYFIGLDDDFYSHWEAEYFFEKAFVKIMNFGLEIQVESLGSNVVGNIEILKIDYNQAMTNLYDAVLCRDSQVAQESVQNAVFVHSTLSQVEEPL